MSTVQAISAKNITSEEQLNDLLESCGIPSQSPKDVDWLSHWWEKEFEPDPPPLARQIVVAGNEGFTPVLCVTVEKDKFITYMFNERYYWFNRLGEVDGFASAIELKEYLKKLVDQYLIDWKEEMKQEQLSQFVQMQIPTSPKIIKPAFLTVFSIIIFILFGIAIGIYFGSR